jgi:hypothetical protein
MGHEDALRLRHPEVGPRMPMVQATVLPAATAGMLAVEFVSFPLPGPFQDLAEGGG